MSNNYGSHYADVTNKISQRFIRQDYPQILVDFSMMNDRSKVFGGGEIALRALTNRTTSVTIINVLWGDEDGGFTRIDTQSNREYDE